MTTVALTKNDKVESRALGVDWNVTEDKFVFNKELPDKPLTRRGVLSVVCAVYDPMGIISPVVISAKLILQELARRKAGWDEELRGEEVKKWYEWKLNMQQVQDLKVNRNARPCEFKNSNMQLHHFCDASQQAYGTVSYLRTKNEHGKIHCIFILSRSRVAPMRVLSILRLELMAAVLAVSVDKLLRKELGELIDESYY
jgi:hypothetical protein